MLKNKKELEFRESIEVAREKIRKADIVCIDLDECLFPFYTQVLIAGQILLECVFKRHKWCYIPRLLFGAFSMSVLLIVTLGNIKIVRNNILMKIYEMTMHGIPMSLIEKHSTSIHTYFYNESLTVLSKLREMNKIVVILSLSISPILKALKNDVVYVNEAIGNNVAIDRLKNTFDKYSEGCMMNGDDKLQAFMKLKGKYQMTCPIIIGHSEDEVKLANYARELGGLSIGINPKKKLKKEFDVVVTSIDWKPLLQLI